MKYKGRSSRGSVWPYVLLITLIIASFLLYLFVYPMELFSNAPTLEYYYSDSCPHCKNFRPIWDKAVAEMKKQGLSIKAVEYDMSKEESHSRASKFNVEGLPTVLYVKDEKATPFNGDRNVNDLVKFVKDQA
jgi:thiol-disulfide isomerase/thioredoxin